MNMAKILHIDENTCLQSYPCKHHVKIQYVNGSIENILISAPKIYEMCIKYNYHLLNENHFSSYSSDQYSNNFLNSLNNSSNGFNKLLKYGKYYNPAYLHYPNSNSKQVLCDKCDKITNVSIGYEQLDLCMLCINELTE